ncbi:hypothetical protein [Roseimicrobium gellanilyticum]|uniref:hypothetical protein n=1 Tax=Roseimicrobium gellanilyticum TaxID=748857 RepID=UPI0011BDB721|nr:hypothetical protein [Roseimicrobium gellanilyticum]
MTNRYIESRNVAREDLESAVASNDIKLLREYLVSAALVGEDLPFLEQVCLNLSAHLDEEVRGNAILGLGHLARRARSLDSKARTIIENGLQDSSSYVRGHAWSAADDVIHFLGWQVVGYKK